MAWRVQVEDESGRVLEQTTCLGRYFVGAHSSRVRLLKYIDDIGDTVFNHQQMSDFLEDWAACEEIARFQASEAHLNSRTWDEWMAVKRLAERVKDHGNLYLKFVGD